MTPAAESKPLTIVELKASNVKRLVAAHIRPDGDLVVLGGKNGAGKTSVLDAITYALAGEKAVPREPVRRGQDKGEVTLDLGDIVVRRTFTKEGGGTLTVSNRDGARYPSPQAMLDSLTGKVSFDPLAFLRLEQDKQAEQLRRLLGLDFTTLDQERAKTYATRTDVNRDGHQLKARFDAMPLHQGVPEAEQSSAEILAEQERAQAINDANATLRQRSRDATRDATTARESIDGARQAVTDARTAAERTSNEIKRLESLLVEQTAQVASREAEVERRVGLAAKADERAKEVGDAAAAAQDRDLAPFKARLAEVEALNAKVRANAARTVVEKELEAKRVESKRLADRLASIDSEKSAKIAATPMPVEGLGFDARGFVTFKGFDLAEASQAERIRVSVAMGLALNPRLRVLLIRDASLLDEDGLAVVAQMAEAAGAQVWLERVGSDQHTTVMVEDGQAGIPEPAEAAPAGEAVAQ